jgi:hypothetical protein
MKFAFVAACNSEEVLRANLLSSHDTAAAEINVQRGAASSAQAYNRGIDGTQADVLIFIHQDMFLPAGWLAKLDRTIAGLEKTDPNWGVLGMFGLNAAGQGEGYVYTTGLLRVLGGDFEGVREIVCLDEIVLVLRRASGLRFDEQLPGFHLYGADICLEARKRAMKSYAFSAFGIHNSNGIAYLPGAYWQTYRYLHRKWRQWLPVRTSCMPITRLHGPALRYLIRNLPSAFRAGKKPGKRVADPAGLLATLPISRPA